MNEDLHNIDDLFRDSLGGYSEEASSAVWERLNNDLDRKQASYYKRKYSRLKKSVLLLLLLCFLSAAYIVFDLLNDKQKPLVVNKADTTMRSFKEKIQTHGNAINKTSGLQNNIDERGRTDTISFKSPGFSVTAGAKKTEDILKKRKGTNDSSVAFIFLPITNKRTKEITFTKKIISKQSETNQTLIPDRYLTSRSFSLEPVPLMNNFYSRLMIMAQSLSMNQKIISPATTPRSAIKSKVKTIHNFSFYGFVAPDFGFDRFEDDDHLAGPGRNREDAHKNEQENISFSAGLLLNYQLTRKISLQSGISITSSSTSIKPETVYAKADNNGHTQYELQCSSGYAYISPKGNLQPVVGDSAEASSTTSRVTYVSIPISISYRIIKGRFSFLPSIGAAVNILSGGKTKTTLSNTQGSEMTGASIYGLKSTFASGQIGLGIEYPLNQKLSISLRPNAKLGLNPINKETPVKSYQNVLSLETGVRIKL